MWEDFRKFLIQGNALDLAIGVIIGVAFGAIVTSLVNDLIMPVVSLATGGIDFANLFYPLKALPAGVTTLKAAQDAGIAVLGYGAFIQAIINFVIIGFVLFMLVRAANNMRKPAAPPPAGPTKDQELLTEIRDLLKRR